MRNTDNKSDRFSWVIFFRQMLISSGLWSIFFMSGLSMGLPTVMIPQIRKEANSTDAITPEIASWLNAVFSFGAIPLYFVIPVLVPLVSRKTTHRLFSIVGLIGFLVCYCSKDIQQLLISLLIQGLIDGYIPISIVVITEYTSLQYRGVFLTIKSATFFWGILVSNSIGTFIHWRNITVVGMICSIYSFITVFFWPESPLWLAERGCFDKCAKAHRWLKGSKVNSEKELEKMIAYHQNGEINLRFKSLILDMLKTIPKKVFYKPFLFCVLLMSLYIFSGKLVCTVYSIDMIKKITNSESTAYTGMLIMDAITVLAMYVGCVMAKVLKRRTFLLMSSSIAVMLLYILSLYLYLVKLSIISEDKYVSLFLLITYSIAVGCGTITLPSTICGELACFQQRNLGMSASVLFFKLVYGSLAKLFPLIVINVGMHGSFFLFALLSSVCLVLIHRYLPETKDKTLQEISEYFKDVKPIPEATELLPARYNATFVASKRKIIVE